MDKIFQLIKELCEIYGVSGYEMDVRTALIKHINKYVDDICIDKMGNLIAHQKGKKPCVLLAAHMDEIGLMVNDITEGGYIKFALVGGIKDHVLLAHKVHILGSRGSVHGVISCAELHQDYEIKSFPSYLDMYVDIGFNSRKAVENAGIEIGNYIIPETQFKTLGNERIVSGKALDDRVGCAQIVELAKKMKGSKRDIYYVFTIQEEAGMYGVRTTVRELDPDFGIAVDITNAEDYKRNKKVMGKGPCITVKDAGLIANRCLVDWFVQSAKKHKIPYQLEVTDVGTTDALPMALEKGGLPTAVIAIPVRNFHSTIAIANMDDIENSIKLLYEVLRNPPKVCVV